MYLITTACERMGLSYETQRFYCNEGLVPNVQRDANNYRHFDKKHRLAKQPAMPQALRHCITGNKAIPCTLPSRRPTIPERKQMLLLQRAVLEKQMAQLQASLDFITDKQHFYDGVLEGRIPYTSNLIDIPAPEGE